MMMKRNNLHRLMLCVFVLSMTLTALISSPHPAVAADRPLLGVIRWDVFKSNDPANPELKSLSPLRWHYRVPYFLSIDADATVSGTENSQTAIDEQITLAKNAGIDYWAFITDEGKDPNGWQYYAMNKYLSSSRKSDVKFSVIIHQYSSSPSWSTRVASLVNFFREPSYVKVGNNRPLVYIFSISDMERQYGAGSGTQNCINELRNQAVAAGLGNPYIVTMWYEPAQAANWATTYGLDAISAYAYGGGSDGTYARYAESNKLSWDSYLGTGKKVIPQVSTGWNQGPRTDNPPPWGGGGGPYHDYPTPYEAAMHIRDGLDYVTSHPEQCDANSILVYAWNEYAEGGWLAPTHSEGSARLDAVKSMLLRTLPSTVAVNDDASGPGNNQFDYAGTWNHHVSGLQPPPPELLANPGFESGIAGWNPQTATIAVDSETVHSGANACRISNRGAAWGAATQDVTNVLLSGGQIYYDCSVWAKLAAGSDTVHLLIKTTDSTGDHWFACASAPVGTTFTEITGSRKVTWSGTLTKAIIYTQTSSSTADMYVDDWSLTASKEKALDSRFRQDDHDSCTADDQFLLRFNGTGARWYGAKAPNMGIAAVSIDDGPETMVDCYQPIRMEDMKLFDSGDLPPGPHTLKVRVTDVRNPGSTDSCVAADRADIICDVEPAGNLLKNAGFETGTSYWASRDSSIAMDTAHARTCSGACMVYGRGTASGTAAQDIKHVLLANGQGNYHCGVYAKLATGADDVSIVISVTDGTGEHLYTCGSAAVGADYLQVSGNAGISWTGTLTQASIYARTVSSTADMYQDDWSLVKRPLVAVTSPAPGLTNDNNPLLTYSVSDGTPQVTFDGAVVAIASGNPLGPLADGPHTVRVTSTDAVGNSAAAEVGFTVDATAPLVSISSPQSGTINGSNPVLEYSVSDGAVEVFVDGVLSNKTSGMGIGPLPAGEHTVLVRSTDAAGNVAGASVSFTLSYAPVEISTTTLPWGEVASPYAYQLAATGGVGGYVWSISAGNLPAGLSLDSGTGAITGVPTAAGSTAITILATDRDGLQASKTFPVNIFAAVGFDDLTRGKAYNSSSNVDSGTTAAMAFDDDIASAWEAASGTAEGEGFNGSWLEVDFGAETTFNKVRLSENGSAVQGYRIEYWNGSIWQTAFAGTTLADAPAFRTVSFPAVTGTKLRAVFTSGTGSAPGIREFAVHFDPALRAGLIGQWHLEGDGMDTAGSNNGTARVGTTFGAGKLNQAAWLDGNGAYIEVSDDDSLDKNLNAMTLSAWVKVDSLPTPTQYYMPVGKESATGGVSYRFVVGSNGGVHFVVATTNNGWYSAGTRANCTTPMAVGTWYHLVGTYDGSLVRCYINGTRQGTGAQPISGTIVNSGSPLGFGYQSAVNINWMNGAVDEVQLYSRGLSDNEVRSLYNAYPGGAPSSSTITSPADGSILNGSSVTIGGTATDPYGTGVGLVQVSTDGGASWKAAVGTTSWSYTWSAPPDGTYDLLSRLTDNLGSTYTAAAAVTVTIDNTAPTGAITINGGASHTNDPAVTLTLAASDINGITGMQLSNDGVGWTAFEEFVEQKGWVVSEGDGPKTVHVKYRDAAGNWSSPFSATITLDTAAPSVNIVSPVDGQTYGETNSPLLMHEVSDGTVVVRVDGVVVEIASGAGLGPLTEGPHTVSIASTDAAGNLGAAAVSFTVDTIPPDTDITGEPANPSGTNSGSFAFGATEAGSTFECSLDGAAWAACTSPFGFSGLADGSHTFGARATDAAGHTDQTPATRSWIISTAPPLVQVNGTSHPSFSAALSAMTGSNIVMKLRGAEITGDVIFNRDVTATLEGGYDATFGNRTGSTVFVGTFTISAGKVVMDKVAIR